MIMEVIELRVRIHCKACEKSIRRALCNIKGVNCVEIDVILSKITVLGRVDRKALIKAVRKTGTRVEIWRPPARRLRDDQRRCFSCIIPGSYCRWVF